MYTISYSKTVLCNDSSSSLPLVSGHEGAEAPKGWITSKHGEERVQIDILIDISLKCIILDLFK